MLKSRVCAALLRNNSVAQLAWPGFQDITRQAILASHSVLDLEAPQTFQLPFIAYTVATSGAERISAVQPACCKTRATRLSRGATALAITTTAAPTAIDNTTTCTGEASVTPSAPSSTAYGVTIRNSLWHTNCTQMRFRSGFRMEGQSAHSCRIPVCVRTLRRNSSCGVNTRVSTANAVSQVTALDPFCTTRRGTYMSSLISPAGSGSHRFVRTA